MKRAFNQTFVVIFMTLLLFGVGGCGKKNPSKMSPMEVINLYYKAKDKGDTETLRRIIYFPPGTTDNQKEKRVKSELTGQDEIIMMQMFDGKVKAEYETILDENTAEVGVIATVRRKRGAFQQIILKKDEGIWKYHYSKWELTIDQLTEELRKNPQNTSLVYLLGETIFPDNPAKGEKYLMKYYELSPGGFWVDDDFLNRLEDINLAFNETDKYEKESLSILSSLPKGSSHRAQIYRELGQLYMEKRNYQKAQDYLDKAEQQLKLYPSPFEPKSLEKALNELKLRLEGKYVDILKEVEMAHKKTR